MSMIVGPSAFQSNCASINWEIIFSRPARQALLSGVGLEPISFSAASETCFMMVAEFCCTMRSVCSSVTNWAALARREASSA